MHFNWIKQVKGSALGLLAMMSCLTACNDEDYLGQQSGSTLKINVTANAPIVSRSIINDTYLPDGHSIGISLFNAENGQDYDGQGYFNVKYTAAGEGSGQTWTSSSTVTLSSTPAKIIAYYPWSDDENFDITAVPVETASQTDYMYAKPIVGASFTSATVVLNMQHALTDIRVNISKGTYTGTGAVTKITAKAPAFATNATMSAVDGTLAGVTGGGSQFETELTDAAISTANVTHDFLVVPLANSTSGEVTIFVTIDDKKFTVNVPYTEAFQQGFTYLYNLVLDNEELVLNNVKVSKWDVVGNTDSEMQFVPTFAEDEYVVAIFGMVEEQDESNGDDGVADVSLFASRAIRNQKFDDIRKRMQDLNIKINTPVSAKKTLSRSSGSNNRSFDYIHNVVGFVGTIDWGDGTTDTYTEATDFPVHTYYQSGKFVVKTKGNIEGLIFPADAYDGDDEDYWFYIYKNSTSRICNIYQIGRQDALEIMYGAFDSASIAEIPEGLFDNCPNVTDFSGTFAYCYNLQSIPEGLFDNCSKVESFVGAFSECTSLTSIPVGLFDKCTKVTSFSGTFSGTDITNIPKGLFDKCTEVTDFSYAFQNCDNLVSIPKGLFDYNTEVTNFYGTFAGSENLFEIPQGLFNECINVKDFSYTFGQCISLKLIPDGLFKTCTQAEFFNQTFRNCTNLEVIGENIFNNPTVIGLDLTSTFEDCTNLTTISGNMFCENTKIYRLDYTFQFCENLIEIPAGLFDKCFVVEDKINCTFNGCKKIASIPAGLLDNFICEGFNCMFGNTGIKSIPEGLFDNNTNASSFDWMFSGCTSLTTIPEGLFDKCTKVTNFYMAFYGCANLTGESPYTTIQVDGVDTKVHLYKRSNYPEYFTAPTNYSDCFYSCTGLTDYSNIPSGWK